MSDLYIKTERLMIWPLRLEDEEQVFEYAKDPEMTYYVTLDPHQSLEDSRNFISSTLKETENNLLDTCTLGVDLRKTLKGLLVRQTLKQTATNTRPLKSPKKWIP